jgi:hypothetical protein
MSARPYLTNNNDIVAKTQPNALRMNASVAVGEPERSAEWVQYFSVALEIVPQN